MNYYASTKDPGSLASSGDMVVHKYTDIWDADMMYGCHCDWQCCHWTRIPARRTHETSRPNFGVGQLDGSPPGSALP